MVFPDSGQQLYLGEGDFSFTCSICKDCLPKGTIVSCFATDLTEDASRNSEFLISSGMTVMTGVNATKLETYPELSRRKFDYIIFNFPLSGHKMKIHHNRRLLREFLASAEPLLAEDGQIWVTLCAGQGGSRGDPIRRAWPDSWQLTEQAAAAGLVLRRLETFQPDLYPGYRATGNRGAEHRPFHTKRGVIHVLARGRPLALEGLSARLASPYRRLLLDGVPLSHAQFWLRRLPPAEDTLAENVVQRLLKRLRVKAADPVYFSNDGERDVSCVYSAEDSVCKSRSGAIDRTSCSSTNADAVEESARDTSVGDADELTWPLHRRLEVHHKGEVYYADASALATGEGDISCLSRDCLESVAGDGNEMDDRRLPDGFCITYIVDDKDGVAQGSTASPLRMELTLKQPWLAAGVRHRIAAPPDVQNMLRQEFGVSAAPPDVKKKPRIESKVNEASSCDCTRLVASCPVGASHAAYNADGEESRTTRLVVAESDFSDVEQRTTTTLHVDRIAACWAGLDDWRLAARSDFTIDNTALRLQLLDAPLHTLCMSFWLDGGPAPAATFSNSRLRRALRSLLGDLLVSLEVVDEYAQPETGRRAQTVRIQYQDLTGPLDGRAARRLHLEVLPDLLGQALGVSAR